MPLKRPSLKKLPETLAYFANDDCVPDLLRDFQNPSILDQITAGLFARVLKSFLKLHQNFDQNLTDRNAQRAANDAAKTVAVFQKLLDKSRDSDAKRSRHLSDIGDPTPAWDQSPYKHPDIPEPTPDPNNPINWRDHLILDPEVDAELPVLKGSQMTGEHIFVLWNDYKWSYAKIKHHYPWITDQQFLAVQAAEAEGALHPQGGMFELFIPNPSQNTKSANLKRDNPTPKQPNPKNTPQHPKSTNPNRPTAYPDIHLNHN